MQIESTPGTDIGPVRVWAEFWDLRNGWCVFRGRGALAILQAGPFASREEAEALLGPAAPLWLRTPTQ